MSAQIRRLSLCAFLLAALAGPLRAYTAPKTVAGLTPGLTTVGYTLLVPATGAVAVARTTTGVYEIGGGAYGAAITGTDGTSYILKWDSGESAPVVATDLLQNTAQSIQSGLSLPAVRGQIRRGR